jgi:ribonuclease P protein component
LAASISTVESLIPSLRNEVGTLASARGIRNFSMEPKEAARFPRTARLLRHADFERVYKQGRRHFSATMTVFYLARPNASDRTREDQAHDDRTRDNRTRAGAVLAAGAGSPAISGLRVGFTVGRVLGGAVQRNRMKRRLREAVRMALPSPGVAVDVVINPKKSLLSVDFSAVRTEVSRAFDVIEQKLAGKPEANRAAGNRAPEAGSRS